MSEPDAARLRTVRWILIGFGLIGAALALTAQPAHAGLTDQLTTTASVTKVVDRVVGASPKAEAKVKAPVRHTVRTVVKQARSIRSTVRHSVAEPVRVVKKTLTVVEKPRAVVHRVIKHTHHVMSTVRPKPITNATPTALPASARHVTSVPRKTEPSKTSSSKPSSSKAAPSKALTKPARPAVAPTVTSAAVLRVAAAAGSSGQVLAPVAELETGPEALRLGASPNSDPGPAPSNSTSTITAAGGAVPAKGMLFPAGRTASAADVDPDLGPDVSSWSVTSDPGFAPD